MLADTNVTPLSTMRQSVADSLQFDRSSIDSLPGGSYLASIICKHLSLAHRDVANGSRSHALLIGPTGSGKTYLVGKLREIAPVPVVTADATTFTEAGYQGRDVDSVFEDALREAQFDKFLAERAIIFIDEFDKLRASPGAERDIRGHGVQYSLLKILDGDRRQVRPARTSRLQATPTESQTVDTSKMLFLFAGAFSAFPELHQRQNLGPADIAPLGYLHELMARIPNVITLDAVAPRDLWAALDQRNGALDEYTALFDALGCKLEIADQARDQICAEAARFGSGYRGLRTALDRAILPRLLDLEGAAGAGTSRCTLTFDGIEYRLEPSFTASPAR